MSKHCKMQVGGGGIWSNANTALAKKIKISTSFRYNYQIGKKKMCDGIHMEKYCVENFSMNLNKQLMIDDVSNFSVYVATDHT